MKKTRIISTDELQSYLKDLKKIPVITHEQQIEIFKKLRNPNITKNEKNTLYNDLIIGNLRFVITIAKQYQNQGMDFLDLISEGNIGLIKAVDRFDPSSGLKFISYAVWWVKQSIMASLNDHSRTIRIPSNIIQDIQKKKKSVIPPEMEIYIDEEICTLPHCVGLDNVINEEGDQLIDVIKDPNENNPENILNTSEEIKKKLTNMLRVLDDREKIIIEKYFGLNGVESNLDDLGEELGCTKERVRQLKDKSLKKLRNESYYLLKYL